MITSPCRPPVAPFTVKATRQRQSIATMASVDGKLKVVVTGAGGRTGGLLMKKLLERRSEFFPVGIVRNQESAKKLKEYGANEDQIFIGDILGENGEQVLSNALKDADRLIICTSAVPVIKPLSLIPVIIAKIFKMEGVRPKFSFKAGQMPEQIDWMGQKKQIDAAKAAHVEKCIVVGSMGGTDRSNFLNTIGDGDILVWKRRAEVYLIESGLNYTIIHPGGLKDDQGGQREIILDVDDQLISSKSKYRSIPREDVAELCVQAITLADRRSVDAVAKDVGDGQPTKDFDALFRNMSQNCSYDDMKDDEIVKKFAVSVSKGR